MENFEQANKRIEYKSIYQKIVMNLLKGMDKGTLIVTLPNGENHLYGKGGGHSADIKIQNYDFFKKLVMFGDIGFGESFCEGDWTTSDITRLVRWFILNIENNGVMSGSKIKSQALNLFGQINKLGHMLKKSTKKKAIENISYHYDLSNEFYKLMLDETMCYSAAIFEGPDSTLHEAQLLKLKTLCEDLDIKKGDHILEIGCGWGGLAIYAVTHYDCKVTGVTISKEQYKFAKEKVKKLGLEDKITILFKDFRDIEGTYEKVVSIEMIEAIGESNMDNYFSTIERVLKPSGVAVIQAITSPDSRYETYKNGVDFIQKHIFPGGLLPSVASMVQYCNKNSTMQIHNLRDIGLDYATTLNKWSELFEANLSKVIELGMDEVFIRKWRYYLGYCEAAFLERNVSDVQVTFIKPNNTSYKY